MMHKFLAYFALATVLSSALISCKSDKPKEVVTEPKPEPKPLSAEEQLKVDVAAKIKAEIKSSKKNLALVAGYEFGMSKKRVEAHTKSSIASRALRIIQTKKMTQQYVYRLPLDPKAAKLDVYMEARYKQSILTKLVCKISGQKSVGSNAEMPQVLTLFTKWYGAPSFKLPAYNGCERYAWIDGNRYLDLRCEGSEIHFAFYDLTNETPPNFDQPVPQIEIIDIN
jgi:integrase